MGRFYRVIGISSDHAGNVERIGESTASYHGLAPVGVPEIDAQGTRRSSYTGPTQPAVKWIRTGLEPVTDTHPIIDSAGNLIIQTGELELTLVSPAGAVSTAEVPPDQSDCYNYIVGFAADSRGNVYVATSRKIYRLDRSGGTVLMRNVSSSIAIGPMVYQENSLVVCCYNGLMVRTAFDGTTLWTCYLGTGVQELSLTTGNDGAIYLGSRSGSVWCINADGTQRWSTSLDTKVYQITCLADGGILALLNSEVVRLDNTGAVMQSITFDEPDNYNRPHLALGVDETIYVQSDTTLFTFAPDGTPGWSADNSENAGRGWRWTSEMYYSSLIADAGATSFLPLGQRMGCYSYPYADMGGVVAIDADGNQLWMLPTREEVVLSPLVASDGTLYLLTRNGTLYAIENGVGAAPPVPAGLAASQGSAIDHIALTWNAVDTASHYCVYRDGGGSPVTLSRTPQWDDYEIVGSDPHVYTVTAHGPFGVSAPSASATGWLATQEWSGLAGGWCQVGGNAQHTRQVSTNLPASIGEPGVMDFNTYITGEPLFYANGSMLLHGQYGYIHSIGLYDAALSPTWQFTPYFGFSTYCALAGDGTIYATPYSPLAGYSDELYAINPDRTFKWTYESLDNAFVTTPVVAADGTAYVHDSDGVWHAVNSDGTARWRLQAAKRCRSDFPAAIGTDGIAYLVGENLIEFTGITVEGKPAASEPQDFTLNAIDPADGTVRWSFAADDEINNIVVAGADDTVYLLTDSDKLFSINSAGVENWQIQLDGYVRSCHICADANGAVYVVYRSADGTDTDMLRAISPHGETLYTWGGSNTIIHSLLIDKDGRVLFVYCYYDENDQYCRDIICLEHDGSELWRFDTGEESIAQLSVSDNGTLYAFSLGGCLVFPPG